MRVRYLPFIPIAGLMAMLQSSLYGQDISPDSLLRLFSDPATSRQGVDIVKAAGAKYIPTLLKWTIDVPSSFATEMGVHRIGLADAFGELKVKQAIPFLLKYLDMDREIDRIITNGSNFRYQADLKNKPAMTALIKIGEIEPLLKVYYSNGMTLYEREKLLVVICEMADKKSLSELSQFLSMRKVDLTDSVAEVDRALKKIEMLHPTK